MDGVDGVEEAATAEREEKVAALAAVQKVGKRGEAEREPVSARRPTGAQVGWYDEARAEVG